MMTGKKGRRSIGLRLNSHLFKVIGVKISKDMFQVGVFDIKGQRLSVYSERTERLQVPVIVRRIRNSIDKALEEYHDIYAIGMVDPGSLLQERWKNSNDRRPPRLDSQSDRRVRKGLSCARHH